MKRTSYSDINAAQTEEALLDLIPGVVVIDLHSALVEFLKSDPKQFYVDSRSPLNLNTKGRLIAIARRLVELRSAIPTNNLELVKSLLLSLTDEELSSLVSISTEADAFPDSDCPDDGSGGEVVIEITCYLDDRLAHRFKSAHRF